MGRRRRRRRADYCRRVDGPSGTSATSARASTGRASDRRCRPPRSNGAPSTDTALADATGDGTTDYCRSPAPRRPAMTCDAFGARRSRAGRSTRAVDGRAWVDFNGDGKADFCRVLSVPRAVLSHRRRLRGTHQLVARSTSATRRAAPGPTSTATAAPTTAAGSATAARDRCISCTLSTVTGFGADVQSRSRSSGAPTAATRGSTSTVTATGLLPPRRLHRRPPAAVLHAVDAGGLRRHDRVSTPTDSAPDRPRVGRPQRRRQGRLLPAVGGGAGNERVSPARSPTARRSARSPAARRAAPPRPGARAARRARPAPHRRHALLRLLTQGPLHRLPGCSQGRPEGRDRQGDVQEGLLAQDLHEAQRSGAATCARSGRVVRIKAA